MITTAYYRKDQNDLPSDQREVIIEEWDYQNEDTPRWYKTTHNLVDQEEINASYFAMFPNYAMGTPTWEELLSYVEG